ncbi:MAG TPA: TetR/AcrR family transcriptional regulator [Gammaproteobacteria bacterium]|nr:TetR/AcrR family transcriptional regulator [Gammaproteobacteria bacterium]
MNAISSTARGAVKNPTKNRILAAAEALFAEHGVASTSLRSITARASVNLAAVNYHFGSKDALIEAVYERRLAPLHHARLARLDMHEKAARDKPLAVEKIVDAFLTPVADLGGGQENGQQNDEALIFTRLLAQTYNEAAPYVHRLMATEHQQVMRRYKAALVNSLPDLSIADVCWRLHFMAMTLHQVIANNSYLQWLDEEDKDKFELTRALRRLTPFLVAGLKAPADKMPAKAKLSA